MQAWKKTTSYIRRHNWYVDTLELDRTAINLRPFIEQIQQRMRATDWKNSGLRIVLAPKSQNWKKSATSDDWNPVQKKGKPKKGKPKLDKTPKTPLRPLAHVDIAEQVVATALMLCLANRVETAQGDPRDAIDSTASRKKVISYGNRLFCDKSGGGLCHRWGSSKLYRAYYQDYKEFLSRPDHVVKSLGQRGKSPIFVVHSDLKQFYDRVRPNHLATALQRLRKNDDEQPFFDFAKQVLNWTWRDNDWNDRREVRLYVEQAKIADFGQVALPQGLVASGFFANTMLLDFDKRLRAAIGQNIAENLRLEDACRYVDDLRLTLTSSCPQDAEDIEGIAANWLQQQLASTAPELQISEEKTEAKQVDKSDNPLINQSIKMNRIQSAISGGFDAVGGIEILDSIQSLMRAQEALHRKAEETIWQFSPLTDVRKETVARFSAARYRTTYRSIRPLLDSNKKTSKGTDEADLETTSSLGTRTQHELDEDTRIFALGLIERWVADPSNVRLLRIGLDLWPESKMLQTILSMLKLAAKKWKGPRRVAWYCLSELFRAGATETGWAEDGESLPSAIDVCEYRKVLRAEAMRLLNSRAAPIPWHLRQQALLFLAVCPPEDNTTISRSNREETKHYSKLIKFLRFEKFDRTISDPEFADLAVLAHHSFPDRKATTIAIRQQLTLGRADAIAIRDPSFAYELVTHGDCPFSTASLPTHLKEDLCLEENIHKENTLIENGMRSLAHIVLKSGASPNVFRSELAVLHFAEKFLDQLVETAPDSSIITPGKVGVEIEISGTRLAEIKRLEIKPDTTQRPDSLYNPPGWCAESDRWRFNLGFLIRFILTQQPDFTRRVPPLHPHWKEKTATYRKAESHWYQRLHGLFNGQQAFGGDWVPITDWLEQFLLALLHWPGCRFPAGFEYVNDGIEAARKELKARIEELAHPSGRAAGTQLLTISAQRELASTAQTLRICVVQTAVPELGEFQKHDLSLSNPSVRKRHRNHLSAALAVVVRIMNLRNTHMENGNGLDWLILPELAVHPKDVVTHLMPFARAHKTLILAGLTYEALLPGKPLQNSAIWILPEWSEDSGLRLRTRRQGKLHLSREEEKFNNGPKLVQGFRPCQWVVRYPWSKEASAQPLRLTGSVCYDATDLELVTTLRDQSDILAIPALNQDVQTFDQMAHALHYHMFQLVIVANNGQYGGSSAYWPAKGFKKQIFHLHGQLQASIAFFEVGNIAEFQKRMHPNSEDWKSPPAGMRNERG